MSSSTDRIVKKTVLRASQERVWNAIADAKQFGSWFGMEFEGSFTAGTPIRARIAPTKVDPEVAKEQEPYAGTEFTIRIERVEPMRLFSFRWHPYGEAHVTTLVTFELEPAADGTAVTITESGFDAIPLERRAKAFAKNEGGWEHQLRLIAKYLALAPK
jgi:uncharacterized protein YndB with AHSA1/START domain